MPLSINKKNQKKIQVSWHTLRSPVETEVSWQVWILFKLKHRSSHKLLTQDLPRKLGSSFAATSESTTQESCKFSLRLTSTCYAVKVIPFISQTTLFTTTYFRGCWLSQNQGLLRAWVFHNQVVGCYSTTWW